MDCSQLRGRPDASAHQIKNVKTRLSNTNGPIRKEEAAFIEQEGDLIAVVAKEKTPLRRGLERIGLFEALCCFRVGHVSFAYRPASLLQGKVPLVPRR